MKEAIFIMLALLFLLSVLIGTQQIEAGSKHQQPRNDVRVLEQVPQENLRFMQPTDVASLLLAD